MAQGIPEIILPYISQIGANAVYVFIALVAIRYLLYGFALYKSIEKFHRGWFALLFVGAIMLQDLALFPIIYLIVFMDRAPKRKKAKPKKAKKKKK